jgi:uncharacterized membrane protein
VHYPPLLNLLLSAAGAVAGVTMIAAGRFTQLAGPLVALQLLPAAATVGAALELGDGGIAARGFGPLMIDVGMVLVAGVIVLTYKHAKAPAPPHDPLARARPAANRARESESRVYFSASPASQLIGR